MNMKVLAFLTIPGICLLLFALRPLSFVAANSIPAGAVGIGLLVGELMLDDFITIFRVAAKMNKHLSSVTTVVMTGDNPIIYTPSSFLSPSKKTEKSGTDCYQ
jgi:hypothetical protein